MVHVTYIQKPTNRPTDRSKPKCERNGFFSVQQFVFFGSFLLVTNFVKIQHDFFGNRIEIDSHGQLKCSAFHGLYMSRCVLGIGKTIEMTCNLINLEQRDELGKTKKN